MARSNSVINFVLIERPPASEANATLLHERLYTAWDVADQLLVVIKSIPMPVREGSGFGEGGKKLITLGLAESGVH